MLCILPVAALQVFLWLATCPVCTRNAGLISAAPGGKRNEKGGLAQASQQVETMVKAKMARPEYIILCLEDSSDWTNATTRRLVMSVCPRPYS